MRGFVLERLLARESVHPGLIVSLELTTETEKKRQNVKKPKRQKLNRQDAKNQDRANLFAVSVLNDPFFSVLLTSRIFASRANF